MKVVSGKVFIACSLDGFIARENGDIDWLHRYPDTGDDHGYARFMATVDGLVMGSGTFKTVLGFGEWPYEKPAVVLSSTLTAQSIPDALAGKVRISDKAPRAIMQELADEGWRAAYIDGGRLIQSFLAEGLIDEMTITQIPVLLGSGRRLFGEHHGDIHLKLESAEYFASGFVQSRYAVER
ncbi:dihydrofolate reductase family protein [Oricola sp.]|uniref:dihydrofolate reductase family protein n=1 Tax=Oricola sp. TaxID=1979950 RepID=UPI003BAB25E2